MNIINNYECRIYNGSKGKVIDIKSNGAVTVNFESDGGELTFYHTSFNPIGDEAYEKSVHTNKSLERCTLLQHRLKLGGLERL